MKLTHVRIENFKGVRECEFSLTDPDGRPFTRFAIVGDNGTGKTTVLQAILAALSQAAGKVYGHVGSPWRGLSVEDLQSNATVELRVVFSKAEVNDGMLVWSAGRKHLSDSHPEVPTEPGALRLDYPEEEVRLTWRVGHDIAVEPDVLHRFRTRLYAEELGLAGVQAPGRRGAALGTALYYSQDRTLARILPGAGLVDDDLKALRQYMVGLWATRGSQNNGEPDILTRLNERYARLFGGRRFVGVAPTLGAESQTDRFRVLLQHSDGPRYDVSQVSGGEEAVLPLLQHFAHEDVAYSVVLIDELDLHLHPPAQQALYAMLPQLGAECQFVFTTHSQFLIDGIPDEEVHHLPGGVPCL